MQKWDNIKENIILAALRAYHRGIQTGNGGNLSARVPGEDLMVIKSSGVSFVDCAPDNLIVTDFCGNVVAGTRKPTREALLHGAIYKNVKGIFGIVHCHSPWSIIWAQCKKELPPITHHAQLKLGIGIPTLDIHYPVVPIDQIPTVLALFSNQPKLPGFLLVAHGQVAVAENVLEAEHLAELIEETAKIAVFDSLFNHNQIAK